MKKISSMILALLLTLSLASCGDAADDPTASNDQSVSDTGSSADDSSEAEESSAPDGGSSEAEESSAPDGSSSEAEESSASDESSDAGENAAEGALGLLNAVWNSYDENDKFPAAGGDEDNLSMEGPGKFGTADTEALDARLAFPAESAGKIDDAASLIHMMNANTFTCGVFHVTSAGDIADVSAALKDHIMQRQWLCGFPEKLVIVQAEGCVVSVFGAADIVDPFIAKLTAAYPDAETVCDEPIV